jgi:hypothetical protein
MQHDGFAENVERSVREVPTQASQTDATRVFILNANALLASKRRIQHGDRDLGDELLELRGAEQRALSAGPFSVIQKVVTPPSGDKQDYMSQAPYFWPNPNTHEGLPYVRRDGERNPEIDRFPDHLNMDNMVAAVEALALAYYFEEDQVYAAKAAQLLRTWFTDPATRMNPHLRYAQAIPGVVSGRGVGLIETRDLTRVVDAVGLLASSSSWKESDQQEIEAWFASFLEWMLQSHHGRDQAAKKNNHGTYFDVQATSYALFAGKRKLARAILESALYRRIAVQIEPNGRQPFELARTNAWSYSVFNLKGLMFLARLGENLGLDLWNYRTPDGRSIRRALDFLVPFTQGKCNWPYRQVDSWQPDLLFPLMRWAAQRYKDQQYKALLSELDLHYRSTSLTDGNPAELD